MLDMAQVIEDFRKRLAAMSDEELRAAADKAYEQSRMLEEITHFKNENMEVILAYLESAEHVKLQSPNFEVQLKVRENVNYYEPCSTIAMAVEAEIPAIIGETMLAQNLIDRFKNYIVRPDELEEMMGIACNSCFVREYQNNKG